MCKICRKICGKYAKLYADLLSNMQNMHNKCVKQMQTNRTKNMQKPEYVKKYAIHVKLRKYYFV